MDLEFIVPNRLSVGKPVFQSPTTCGMLNRPNDHAHKSHRIEIVRR